MGIKNSSEESLSVELAYPLVKQPCYRADSCISSPEVVRFVTAIQSCDPDDNLFHYLTTGDQGTKARLAKIVTQTEKEIGTVLKTLINDLEPNRLWEIPTKELCDGLLDLFKFFGIRTVVEAGAGLGLLSACLRHHSSDTVDLETHTPTYPLSTWHSNSFTYCPTVNATFAKMTKVRDTVPQALVVSWIHGDYETELLISVVKNSISYLFLVGVGAPGDDVYMCQSDSFHEKMTCNLGYYYAIVPLKQISRQDYFIYDRFKKVEDYGESSRSCVVMYVKKEIAEDQIKRFPKESYDSINFPMVSRRASLFRDKFKTNEIKIPTSAVRAQTLGTYTPFTVDYMVQDSIVLKRLTDAALHSLEKTIGLSKSKL